MKKNKLLHNLKLHVHIYRQCHIQLAMSVMKVIAEYEMLSVHCCVFHLQAKAQKSVTHSPHFDKPPFVSAIFTW